MTTPATGPGPVQRPALARVLVTGATGLLGSAVVGVLLAEGSEVTALVRDPDKARRLLPAHERLTLHTGDVNDPGSYRPALPGADAVIHTAAYFREYYQPEADLGLLHRTNVEAVTALLGEAVAAGVPAVVQTSSINTVSGGTDQEPADESAPPPGDWERNAYRASKIRAERAIREFCREHPSVRVPLVLPGWMWGPGDAGPTSAGRLFLTVARGELRAVPRAGNHVVDARDVAFACVRAAEKGESLRRYIVAGRFQRLAGTLAGVAEATGTRAPREIPAAAALTFATILQTAARLRGKPPVATREGVRTLLDGNRMRLTSARAEAELGVAFRPLTDTFADEAAWYADAGLLTADA
ncbi:NAD-dependent epimerase/dehydratase family protein [Streptomyces sp. DSM 44917]|uniref:NAD-dependent epimerase/dehydratase family protein n=1 Tax=Streptomyces boetiae TaxID=3075541 RepID=A0ABU2L718_9ACTN|nr:NAD-dependent epimerase/dehydratase family protein [Streptomyces sp. DSM 44917]MDT0307364.1 NAD-dependent epimerase/dehydratase family protein [Streptomyces sp. DSM 44917]